MSQLRRNRFEFTMIAIFSLMIGFLCQCINTTSVRYITQQKTVVERQCSDVPDQECKINTVIKDNPVNSTECKLEKENKCSIVTVPTKEKECRKILEKKCRTVSEIVTEIVQVPT